MKLKVAGAQLGPYAGSPEGQRQAVLEQGEALIEAHDPDLLVFPELLSTPYFALVEDDSWFGLAEPIPGPATDTLAALARKGRCHVTGSLFHRDGERFRNTAVLLGPDGALLDTYSKTHIPDINHGTTRAREAYYFTPGDRLLIRDIGGVRTGLLICYDRSFPEAWRALALGGAELVVVLASSSGFRSAMFLQELQVRALENGVWVAAVNKGGDEHAVDAASPADFYGSSCIIAPDGDVQQVLGREPAVGLACEIDTAAVAAARARLGYFEARRPELYGDIVRGG